MARTARQASERGISKLVSGKSVAVRRKTPAQVDHPALQVGDKVMCQWVDGTKHMGQVVKTRLVADEGKKHTLRANDLEYYIHYLNQDKRLDEWLTHQRILLSDDDADDENKVILGRVQGRRCNEQDVEAAKSEEATAAADDDDEADLLNGDSDSESVRVRNVECIQFGKYDIKSWYYSPFPEEYSDSEKLYFCEFCLNYYDNAFSLSRHAKKCRLERPPGDEIYRDGAFSVFEVDGATHKTYCQNLCLIGKLFLEHKTLHSDVDPFLFYIATVEEGNGCHQIVGYFSKDKIWSTTGYNLACIITLPPYQQRGYGQFLISLSFELSKREGIVGAPERPLSDLGELSFRSYWKRAVVAFVLDNQHLGEDYTVRELSKATSINLDDLTSVLKELNVLKYIKGQNVVPVNSKTAQRLNDEFPRLVSDPTKSHCDPKKLVWTPKKKARKVQ